MRRILVLLVAVLGLIGLAEAPDQMVRSAQAAQTYTQVTVTCRGPVLDVMTGQPVT